MSGLNIVVAPAYTPRDFACQRFDVFLRKGRESMQWPRPKNDQWGYCKGEAEELAKRLADMTGGTVVKEG